jgi:hypothetical protein
MVKGKVSTSVFFSSDENLELSASVQQCYSAILYVRQIVTLLQIIILMFCQSKKYDLCLLSFYQIN